MPLQSQTSGPPASTYHSDHAAEAHGSPLHTTCRNKEPFQTFRCTSMGEAETHTVMHQRMAASMLRHLESRLQSSTPKLHTSAFSPNSAYRGGK